MQRALITLGIVLVVLGLLWPWLGKLGLGRLPGDIFIQRGGFRFYFPLTSALIVSVVLSLLFWLFRRQCRYFCFTQKQIFKTRQFQKSASA